MSLHTVTGVSTNSTTNITADTSDNASQLGSVYQILTAITTGGVVAVLTMFFLKNKAIGNHRKPVFTGKKI